jgi:polyferredoxin
MSALEKYKEYLLEEEKKKKAELDFKVAKAKFFYLLFEFFISIIGLSIIGYHTNGWVCLGLFLVLWGNNMGVIRNILSPKNNSTRKIWSRK